MYLRPLFIYPIYCAKLNKQNYLLAKSISAAWVILPSIYFHMVLSTRDNAILLISLATMFLVSSYIEESSCLRFVHAKIRAKLIALSLLLSLTAVFVNSLPNLSGLYFTLYRVTLVAIFLLSSITEYIWSGIRFRDGKSFIYIQFLTWDLNLKNIGTWVILFGGLSGLGIISISLITRLFSYEHVYAFLYQVGLDAFLIGFLGVVLYTLETLYWLGRNRRQVVIFIREMKENSIFGKKFKERVR